MNNLNMETVDGKADSTNNGIDKVLRTEKIDPSLCPSYGAKDGHMAWRRIDEELPERNDVVLVCFKGGYDNSLIRAMAYRTFDPEKCCWSTDLVYEEPDGYTVDDIEVTHWMPLPDLPL